MFVIPCIVSFVPFLLYIFSSSLPLSLYTKDSVSVCMCVSVCVCARTCAYIVFMNDLCLRSCVLHCHYYLVTSFFCNTW